MNDVTRRNLLQTGAVLAMGAVALGSKPAKAQERLGEAAMPAETLTPAQQSLVQLLDLHIRSEFEEHDADAAMRTMTANPHLVNVPVMTGGFGYDGVREFYSKHFIPGLPPDTEVEVLSRTVSEDRVILEIVFKFTHSIEMPWFLPGVPPTGKRVEVPKVVIVHFRDGKIDSEHIYWDQASVLVQLGLLDARRLPIAGAETARKLRDPSLLSNELIESRG